MATYEEYLTNLMGDLNTNGGNGMFNNAAILPDVSNIRNAVNAMYQLQQVPSSPMLSLPQVYTPPQTTAPVIDTTQTNIPKNVQELLNSITAGTTTQIGGGGGGGENAVYNVVNNPVQYTVDNQGNVVTTPLTGPQVILGQDDTGPIYSPLLQNVSQDYVDQAGNVQTRTIPLAVQTGYDDTGAVYTSIEPNTGLTDQQLWELDRFGYVKTNADQSTQTTPIATVSDYQIRNYVMENLDNPQAIADAANTYNVSIDDLIRATGYSADQINSYFLNNKILNPPSGVTAYYEPSGLFYNKETRFLDS